MSKNGMRPDNVSECDQCRAIVDEVMAAFGKVPPSVRDELRAKLGTVSSALFSSEHWEELIEKFPFRRFQPDRLGEIRQRETDILPWVVKMREAFRRMSEHMQRTGHRPLGKG